jgi:hypothetical protein
VGVGIPSSQSPFTAPRNVTQTLAWGKRSHVTVNPVQGGPNLLTPFQQNTCHHVSLPVSQGENAFRTNIQRYVICNEEISDHFEYLSSLSNYRN